MLGVTGEVPAQSAGLTIAARVRLADLLVKPVVEVCQAEDVPNTGR